MINDSMEKTKKKKTKIVLNWKIIIYGILLGICFVLITWCIELNMLIGNPFRFFVFNVRILHIDPLQWIIDLGVFMLGFFTFIIGVIVNYRILKIRREKRRIIHKTR